MARIASVEKLGRYETPKEVVDILATLAHADGESVLLDPCCAEGIALSTLGKAWGCKTVGNEIDSLAAEKARAVCDLVTYGPIEFLRVEGQVGALFLNPPYDVRADGSRLELRFLELATPWLRTFGHLVFVVPDYILQIDQVVGFICENYENIKVRRFPDPHYDVFKQCVLFARKREVKAQYCWREKDDLKQHTANMPTLKFNDFKLKIIRHAFMPELTVAVPGALDTLELAAEQGPRTSPTFQELSVPAGQVGDFQPVMKPLPGHAAALVMDGKIDGTKVHTDDGHALLVCGHSEKVMVAGETTTDEEGRTRREDKERVVTAITALDLGNLELTTLRSDKEPEKFEEFLKLHQAALIRSVDERYPPLSIPEVDMPGYVEALKHIHAPGSLPGHPPNGLLPRQAECAVALAKLLEKQKCGLLIGQLGCGKTAITLGLMGLIGKGNWKLVVMCPGQTAPKWAREAEKMLREFGVKSTIAGDKEHSVFEPVREGWAYTNGPQSEDNRTPKAMQRIPTGGRYLPGKLGEWQDKGDGIMVAKIESTATITRWSDPDKGKKKPARGKPILDIRRAFAEPNPSVIVLSFETAKMGNRWEPAFIRKIKRMKWTETYEEEVKYGYRTVSVERTEKHDEVIEIGCCPDCGATLQYEDGKPWALDGSDWKAKRKCPECGAALWTNIPFGYGGRVAAAEFISQHYTGRYFATIDECHNCKKAERDIGAAAMDLVSGAIKAVSMTGTIYDGKASGIAATMFRCFPAFREEYPWGTMDDFVKANGLFKEIHTTGKKERTTGSYGYNREKENVRKDEIAGATPAIISLILSHSVFIKKAHVKSDLPPLVDFRVPVEPTDVQQETLGDLNRIHETAKGEARRGSPGLLSQWVQASVSILNYGGCDTLTSHKSGSYEVAGVLASSDDVTDPLLPKDTAILERIKAEIAQGRGVGIFFELMERRPWHTRMMKLLEREGIFFELLTADTCEKDDRETWYRGFIARCEAKRVVPVLLMSGSLNYEGMDFIELPTLINTSVDFRLARLLQRNERHHRLTQEKPCHCYYFYYQGTYEEAALGAVAAKARAARKVDGDLIDGLAEMGMETEDLMVTLMRLAAQDAETIVTDWGDMQEANKIEEASAMLTKTASPAREDGAKLKREWSQPIRGVQLVLF